MNWTTPAELRAQLQRRWDSGQILGELVTGQSCFPLRLRLSKPTSSDLTQEFDAVREWIARLRRQPHIRLDTREFKHRVLGVNEVPSAVWVETLDDTTTILRKRKETAQFQALIDQTQKRQPALLDWLAHKPLLALSLVVDWERLLAVVDWIAANPRSNVYLRQVDVPNVHSKFIERHRRVLSQWLDSVLPPDAIDESATGIGGFARRYGFRDKPTHVRLRSLDPTVELMPGFADADITLDADTFARLDPAVTRVLIVENEVSFLAIPPMENSLLVFGAGYGFDAFDRVGWLDTCDVYYWGDIDTHGFTILDQLRTRVPQVHSLMMDRDTLLAFESQWGVEDKQTTRDLPRLNNDECALYDELRDNRIRPNLRLEQERIGFSWVQKSLENLGAACG